jgi:hypothetical protein
MNLARSLMAWHILNVIHCPITFTKELTIERTFENVDPGAANQRTDESDDPNDDEPF